MDDAVFRTMAGVAPMRSVAELKRRLYLVYLSSAAVVSLVVSLVRPNMASPAATEVLAVLAPVGVVAFVVGCVVLWRWPQHVGLVEKGMYALAYPALLGALGQLVVAAPDARAKEQALHAFSLWLPLVVVWSFLAFGSVRGLVAALAFLVATGGMLVAFHLSGIVLDLTALAFGVHIAVAAAVFSFALFTFAYLLERQSAARAAAEALAEFAATDSVTGLPNRFAFEALFDQARALAHRTGQRLAVYFIDLDDFKRVNDTFGHGAGDTLLRQFGRRLRRAIRGSDIVARLGGDEFVVLAYVADVAEAELVAGKLLDATRAPIALDATKVALSASIGVSVYPDHGLDGESLLQHADAEMYRTKANGKRGWSAGHPLALRAEVVPR
jgi:diguanylate cyclase (GGDEF)-like protein